MSDLNKPSESAYTSLPEKKSAADDYSKQFDYNPASNDVGFHNKSNNSGVDSNPVYSSYGKAHTADDSANLSNKLQSDVNSSHSKWDMQNEGHTSSSNYHVGGQSETQHTHFSSVETSAPVNNKISVQEGDGSPQHYNGAGYNNGSGYTAPYNNASSGNYQGNYFDNNNSGGSFAKTQSSDSQTSSKYNTTVNHTDLPSSRRGSSSQQTNSPQSYYDGKIRVEEGGTSSVQTKATAVEQGNLAIGKVNNKDENPSNLGLKTINDAEKTIDNNKVKTIENNNGDSLGSTKLKNSEDKTAIANQIVGEKQKGGLVEKYRQESLENSLSASLYGNRDRVQINSLTSTFGTSYVTSKTANSNMLADFKNNRKVVNEFLGRNGIDVSKIDANTVDKWLKNGFAVTSSGKRVKLANVAGLDTALKEFGRLKKADSVYEILKEKKRVDYYINPYFNPNPRKVNLVKGVGIAGAIGGKFVASAMDESDVVKVLGGLQSYTAMMNNSKGLLKLKRGPKLDALSKAERTADGVKFVAKKSSDVLRASEKIGAKITNNPEFLKKKINTLDKAAKQAEEFSNATKKVTTIASKTKYKVNPGNLLRKKIGEKMAQSAIGRGALKAGKIVGKVGKIAFAPVKAVAKVAKTITGIPAMIAAFLGYFFTIVIVADVLVLMLAAVMPDDNWFTDFFGSGANNTAIQSVTTTTLTIQEAYENNLVACKKNNQYYEKGIPFNTGDKTPYQGWYLLDSVQACVAESGKLSHSKNGEKMTDDEKKDGFYQKFTADPNSLGKTFECLVMDGSVFKGYDLKKYWGPAEYEYTCTVEIRKPCEHDKTNDDGTTSKEHSNGDFVENRPITIVGTAGLWNDNANACNRIYKEENDETNSKISKGKFTADQMHQYTAFLNRHNGSNNNVIYDWIYKGSQNDTVYTQLGANDINVRGKPRTTSGGSGSSVDGKQTWYNTAGGEIGSYNQNTFQKGLYSVAYGFNAQADECSKERNWLINGGGENSLYNRCLRYFLSSNRQYGEKYNEYIDDKKGFKKMEGGKKIYWKYEDEYGVVHPCKAYAQDYYVKFNFTYLQTGLPDIIHEANTVSSLYDNATVDKKYDAYKHATDAYNELVHNPTNHDTTTLVGNHWFVKNDSGALSSIDEHKWHGWDFTYNNVNYTNCLKMNLTVDLTPRLAARDRYELGIDDWLQGIEGLNMLSNYSGGNLAPVCENPGAIIQAAQNQMGVSISGAYKNLLMCALEDVGKACYSYGGKANGTEVPSGIDCSGFVSLALRQAGVFEEGKNLSTEQFASLSIEQNLYNYESGRIKEPIDSGQIKPGYVVVKKKQRSSTSVHSDNHVVIFLGKFKMPGQNEVKYHFIESTTQNGVSGIQIGSYSGTQYRLTDYHFAWDPFN